MENKIILVGGYCATGKSTFSHKLSELLNIPCFNKDTVKEMLGDSFGYDNCEVLKQKGNDVTFLLMLHIAECILKAGEYCILESNFTMAEANQLRILLGKYNCDCLTFVFIGDENILWKRYGVRDISEKRHWIHIGNYEENYQQKHGIGEISIGRTIVKDATSFENINYDELYSIAEEFLK